MCLCKDKIPFIDFTQNGIFFLMFFKNASSVNYRFLDTNFEIWVIFWWENIKNHTESWDSLQWIFWKSQQDLF